MREKSDFHFLKNAKIQFPADLCLAAPLLREGQRSTAGAGAVKHVGRVGPNNSTVERNNHGEQQQQHFHKMFAVKTVLCDLEMLEMKNKVPKSI